jgi:hypothetical protein
MHLLSRISINNYDVVFCEVLSREFLRPIFQLLIFDVALREKTNLNHFESLRKGILKKNISAETACCLTEKRIILK